MHRETVKQPIPAVLEAMRRARSVQLPRDYVMIAVDAHASRHYHCGKQLAKSLSHGRDLAPDQVERLGFPCYDVKPGATVTLTISFHGDGHMRRPTGELRLKTDRGKLSAMRFKLDGHHENVTVELALPDETIQVSLRAFLTGYGRGKVHLHLE